MIRKRPHQRGSAIVALALLAGCSLWSSEKSGPPVGLVAVLPIVAIDLPARAPATGETPRKSRLTSDAERAVTAQIYGALADRSDFRFVPDLTVNDALRMPAVTGAPTLVEKARALGKAVSADGVVFGTVSRFEERVGTEFGASEPASVAFRLGLVATGSGDLVWRGEFDETQEPLTSNLLKFWIFWGGGPRWLSARELARVGVDRLVNDMASAARAYEAGKRPQKPLEF